MAFEKVFYWMALGLVVVGLYSKLARQDSLWVRQLIQQPVQLAEAISCRVADHAQTLAWQLTDRASSMDQALQIRVERSQARVACVNASVRRCNARMARVNAAMARFNANAVRLRAEGVLR